MDEFFDKVKEVSGVIISDNKITIRPQRADSRIKLRGNKNGKGYVTSYTVNIGCKEARDVGFLNDDKTSKPVRKIIDAERHRIIIELDDKTDID